MTENHHSPSGRTWDWLMVLCRWLLGAHFIWMGLVKAWDPVGFLKLLRQYELTQQPLLLNSIAGALPWFEVFCGVLLVLGVAVRGTALLCLGMLVPFTVIVLKRAMELSATHHLPFCLVKFDCGCGAGEVFICRKLLENSVQILVSSLLLSGLGRSISWRYQIFGSKEITR